MKSKRGDVDIPYMAILEIGLAVAIIFLLLQVKDVAVDTKAIVEIHTARDVGTLFEVGNGVTQNFNYIYPSSLPGRSISIIDNYLYVHSTAIVETVIPSLITKDAFIKTQNRSVDYNQRVDASFFSVVHKDGALFLSDGVEATILSTTKLDFTQVKYVVITSSQEPLVVRFRNYLDLGLRRYEGPTQITFTISAGDVTQILYGTDPLVKELAENIANLVSIQERKIVAIPASVQGIHIILGNELREADVDLLEQQIEFVVGGKV